MAQFGASKIYVGATHPVFCCEAADRLRTAPIVEIVVSNSLPLRPDQKALDRKAIEWLREDYDVVQGRFSPDGRYLAYAVSMQGSAWREVRVRDVRSGQDLSDELRGIRESPISWTKDERGFFYVRSDLGVTPAVNPVV